MGAEKCHSSHGGACMSNWLIDTFAIANVLLIGVVVYMWLKFAKDE